MNGILKKALQKAIFMGGLKWLWSPSSPSRFPSLSFWSGGCLRAGLPQHFVYSTIISFALHFIFRHSSECLLFSYVSIFIRSGASPSSSWLQHPQSDSVPCMHFTFSSNEITLLAQGYSCLMLSFFEFCWNGGWGIPAFQNIILDDWSSRSIFIENLPADWMRFFRIAFDSVENAWNGHLKTSSDVSKESAEFGCFT